MISMPGTWEWIAIVIVFFIIFGKKLPGMMRTAGKSIAEFKKGFKGVEEKLSDIKEVKQDIDNIKNFKIG
jgi:TatA/E family protein of Tat protein translocase